MSPHAKRTGVEHMRTIIVCWLSHLSWTLAEIKDTEDWTSWNCNKQRTKSDQVATVKVDFILVRIQSAEGICPTPF